MVVISDFFCFTKWFSVNKKNFFYNLIFTLFHKQKNLSSNNHKQQPHYLIFSSEIAFIAFRGIVRQPFFI